MLQIINLGGTLWNNLFVALKLDGLGYQNLLALATIIRVVSSAMHDKGLQKSVV